LKEIQDKMALIYTLVFLGFFAAALVAPVMSPMFLHPVHGNLLPPATTFATKAFLLGVALAAGRLGELVGSPILGQLSDRFGRKRLLALAMAVTATGNLVVALAIEWSHVWLLIVGQFVIGFVGVLLVLAQAQVAGESKGAEKTRRFGLIFMACGLAYVFAPVIGGHLADVALYPWASYALPFYVSTAICVLCLGLILWRFPDSQEVRRKKLPSGNSMFGELSEAFQLAPFRALLVVNFFLYLGIDFVFQFNPVYFVQTWHFTSSQVGWFMSYMSIAMVATQWFLVRPVGRRWVPRAATAGSAVALGALLMILVTPEQSVWLYAILPAVGAAMALATTNMSALLSDVAPADSQGGMLGVSHSARVLGSTILCFCGGILAGHSAKAPILAAAVASLLAAALLMLPRQRQ
jgi:DHA1 family tetracycline resistance protein-like MFS transporter